VKADRCGTMSEQAREAAGWITVRGTFGPRCDNCAHADARQRERTTSWWCTRHRFSTKANAYCPKHKAIPDCQVGSLASQRAVGGES
jgi:ribosomal protein L37AE/L43A